MDPIDVVILDDHSDRMLVPVGQIAHLPVVDVHFDVEGDDVPIEESPLRHTLIIMLREFAGFRRIDNQAPFMDLQHLPLLQIFVVDLGDML